MGASKTFQALWSEVERQQIKLTSTLLSALLLENHSASGQDHEASRSLEIQLGQLHPMVVRWLELRQTLESFGQAENSVWSGLDREPLVWFSVFAGETTQFSPDDWPVIWSAHVRQYLEEAGSPLRKARPKMSQPMLIMGYQAAGVGEANHLAATQFAIPSTEAGQVLAMVFDQVTIATAVEVPYMRIGGLFWPQLGESILDTKFEPFHTRLRSWLYFCHQAWFTHLDIRITNQVVKAMAQR